MLRTSLQLHKWLALIVGVQVVFWVVGGIVMTVIPIETVRGQNHAPKVEPAVVDLHTVVPAVEITHHAGLTVTKATLKSTPRGPIWQFESPDGHVHSFDAATGEPVIPLTETEARRFAAAGYTGPGKPVRAVLHAKAPAETGKHGPLWQVEFDDGEESSVYVSPDTGEVISRRSNLWRFYDFFWRLHILDFGEGDNFNHPLIILAAILTLPMVVTGWIALVIKLGRDWKGRRGRRAAA